MFKKDNFVKEKWEQDFKYLLCLLEILKWPWFCKQPFSLLMPWEYILNVFVYVQYGIC